MTLDQGIPAHELAEEVNGAEEPPPKKTTKKRKAAKPNGVVAPPIETQVNGDAMDVDHNGHTRVTNSVRADSEMIASDVESPSVADLPISTLSIGQSAEIQTEQPADLAPHTVFSCSVNDPDKVVNHVKWGRPESNLLLAAGKSLFRLHLVSNYAIEDSGSTLQQLNLDLPLENYSITALCWNARDEVTVAAREERTNELGEVMRSDKILKVIDGGGVYQVVSSTAGLVSTLQYNDARQLLLAISSDDNKGSIKIWKDRDDDAGVQLPSWADFTETTIYDAAWLGEDSFVVCGDQLLAVYDVNESLSCRPKVDTDVTWEIVKCDPTAGIIVALGVKEQQSFLGILRLGNDALTLHTLEYPDIYFTDLDLRRTPDVAENTASPPSAPAPRPALLATCATSGVVRVWDARKPLEGSKALTMADTAVIDDIMATSIAFSPNGQLLAAAGPYAVSVWDLEKRDEPIAVWHAASFTREEWDPSVDGETRLSWDSDSSRLSISLGNQVSVCVISTCTHHVAYTN